MAMTQTQKLELATEFARRVLAEAMAVDTTALPAADILAWARELDLVEVRRVTKSEAQDFNVEPGTEVYDYAHWMHREHQKAVAKVNRLLAENGKRFVDAMGS